MATAHIEYLGELRTKCKHEKSSEEFITDAPTDNNGRGEAFSPTDLVATAYVSCMLTIIGIHCNKHGLEFKRGNGTVSKSMESGPRRISQLEIEMDLAGNDWTEDEQKSIIEAGENCPVAKSVNENIMVTIRYQF